ncbi:MAG: YqhR family membrane protein [Acidimicrobiales bacterium]
MEDFNLIAALVAGFVGTVVMSAMMTMAASAKVTDMPPMALVTGAMMTGDRRRATAIGSVVHYLMMGTVVFGIVYGLLFDAFDSASWLVGVAIGLAHGAIVGLVFMPMMPLMHPRMEHDLVGAGTPAERATVATDSRGEVHLSAPGVLGKGWGSMTPAGILIGHAVYGVVLALVYGWIN